MCGRTDDPSEISRGELANELEATIEARPRRYVATCPDCHETWWGEVAECPGCAVYVERFGVPTPTPLRDGVGPCARCGRILPFGSGRLVLTRYRAARICRDWSTCLRLAGRELAALESLRQAGRARWDTNQRISEARRWLRPLQD